MCPRVGSPCLRNGLLLPAPAAGGDLQSRPPPPPGTPAPAPPDETNNEHQGSTWTLLNGPSRPCVKTFLR
eukprot:9053959-Pyramimonas_sp.AAC.2